MKAEKMTAVFSRPPAKQQIAIACDLISSGSTALDCLKGFRKTAVITDRNVMRLHWKSLEGILKSAGIRHELFSIEPGEKSKSLSEAGRISN
ncbi:MAG: hypothetical protein NT067_01335 [Candidatus Diapherotrites archaeon]|nr:hypothetical protein [Candidatus Diapherotrites archaeon]